MKQNNEGIAEDSEEKMLQNFGSTRTGNHKNCKESTAIEILSEHENTGLPTRSAEPASGYPNFLKSF